MSISVHEAAVLSAYTGVLIGKFGDMHQYVERILGRPVTVHELPRQYVEIREAARKDFLAIKVKDVIEFTVDVGTQR